MAQLLEMKTRQVAVSSVEPYEKNPRRGDVDVIAESLTVNGQYRPIVVNARTNQVLAGNHTLLAARQLGWLKIAASFIDVDDVAAARIVAVDNRAADLGDYDDPLLLELLEGLPSLLGSGYSDVDLAELVEGVAGRPPLLEDPDSVPALQAKVVTKPGDVWLLGPHRVLCGDSTDPAAFEKVLDGDLVDVVWTDPPYGIEYVGSTADALTIKGDDFAGLEDLLTGAVAGILSACKPGAAVYVAAPAGPQSVVFAVVLSKAGLYRQRLVWVKNSLVLGHSDYHYKHEDIFLGYAPDHDELFYGIVPGATGRRGRGGEGWYGDNAQTSVLEFPKPAANREHPTMKPVMLIEQCVSNSCPPGGVVLDPFGGSGSTLIAAHELGKAARLIELDPVYVDVICRRWRLLTGESPVLERTGRKFPNG